MRSASLVFGTERMSKLGDGPSSHGPWWRGGEKRHERFVTCRVTYYNSHSSTLHKSGEDQQRGDDLPALGPALHTTCYYYGESDQGAKLSDNIKGDQEPDRPPHAAEVAILLAVGRLRERYTCTFDGRTALVEAIGVFALAVLWHS